MLKKQTMRGGGKTPLNSNGYDDLQHLVVDTSLFSATFQSALISTLSRSLGDFDSYINGTLIHSDNFQALNLLQARYREQVKCIYIDPPYNTGGDGFIYKDSYQHSSWLSLMSSRLELSRNLMNRSSLIYQSINDNEEDKLKILNKEIFNVDNFVADLIWANKEGGGSSDSKLFRIKHEHILAFARDINNIEIIGNAISNEDRYKSEDEYFSIRGKYYLQKLGMGSIQYSASLDYPIEVPDGSFVMPADNNNGKKACWRWSKDKFEQNKKAGFIEIKKNKEGIWIIYTKQYMNCDNDGNPIIRTQKPMGIIDEYSSTQASKLLDCLGLGHEFNYSKPIGLLHYLIARLHLNNQIILDYFAGSGTTAHAVINLNREDNGNRQYILVEQGEYFDTVLKPRVQKVIYSKAWKEGKPVAEGGAENLQGVPQIVKVLKLESYEDTLNNLELRRSGLFDNLSDDVQQDYLLHYMLNIESRGSLLNVSHFENPFDYGLNISTTSAGAYEWQKVDLVETFNYLIGAKVINVDDKRAEQGFVAIECRLPNQSADEKTLIFWRDCERVDYDGLQTQFDRLGINPADSEYSQVYVNGDHTLETVWDGEQSGSLKIISIEDAFLSLMFEGDA